MTSLGHIYLIFTPLDNSFSYIGSTFNKLHKRFQTHKRDFKYWLKNKAKRTNFSIFPYFEKYGIENFKIIKIKSYNVIRTHKKDHKHLWAYETFWISKTKNCCNIQLPFNPLKKQAQKECNKKYRDKHKEYYKEYYKKYNEENEDKIKEYNKKYYEKNLVKIKKYRDEHKEYHKKKYYDKIKEKNKIKFTCACGSTVRNCQKLRHFKTKKHINFCQKI
jgi:uncharacterized protein with NAD-binding domain and iron-sulfur cluster